MALRAFPVLYAKDVDAVAAFYVRLGSRTTAVLVARSAASVPSTSST
jgi:hypothetical protein